MEYFLSITIYLSLTVLYGTHLFKVLFINQLKSIWFDLVKHFILIFRKVDNIFHRISQVCLHLLLHQLPNCQKCIIFHQNFWVCHDHDDGGTSVFHSGLSALKILHWWWLNNHFFTNIHSIHMFVLPTYSHIFYFCPTV